jgi:anti-sigma factor RsiW
VNHPDALKLSAYFDGELKAASALDVDQHLLECAICRAQLQELKQTRSALRAASLTQRAPEALRERLSRALDQEARSGTRKQSPQRPFWWGAFSGGITTAAAALLAVVVWLQPFQAALVDELLAAHLQSTHSHHLVDVISTDRHTVKPWFAGRADVSPVVADFETQGFRLVGGRVDNLAQQHAAVTVYQHGQHVVSVYSWAANRRLLPPNSTRRGYHLAFWRAADIAYCAVSDTGWDELIHLQRLLQAQEQIQAARESRE